MVAGSFERIGQLPEDRAGVMLDHRGFPVHQPFCSNDLPSEGDRERLMAETDSEQRKAPGKVPNCFNGNAGLIGCAGAWRNDDTARFQCLDLIESDLIVAVDADVLT